MTQQWTLEDGEKLIRYARANIENYLTLGLRLDIPDDLINRFGIKGGAFVTLNKYSILPGNPLRGCIGIILPHYALIETVQNVSISAATEDPRFPKVKYEEMDKILVEISILSIPEKITVTDPLDYEKEVVIGRDGLIISKGHHRGLLLPQVPVEHDRNWTPIQFLEQTCQKAWLAPDAWKDIKNTTVERFTATIFEETEPRGLVRRKEIGE
ncbi:hypothetical protein NEF87_004020 [Candidatus Lokiarchaeum ossiferum]|uniref:Protein NEF87_004020 n=1 Tax=Candidatus Lokiarchaeum ossiferum TaxID=2951803 RepID=A0ABY6HWD8_9ARCH|nr:hypothetical protein NEF87_004020 [Candidatus Lokiarchaeum sp. B-35]